MKSSQQVTVGLLSLKRLTFEHRILAYVWMPGFSVLVAAVSARRSHTRRRTRPEWIICAAAQANRTLCDLSGGAIKRLLLFRLLAPGIFIWAFGTARTPNHSTQRRVGWAVYTRNCVLCLNKGHSLYIDRLQSKLCRLYSRGGSKVALQIRPGGGDGIGFMCHLSPPHSRAWEFNARVRRERFRMIGQTPQFPHSLVFIERNFSRGERWEKQSFFSWCALPFWKYIYSAIGGVGKQRAVFVLGGGRKMLAKIRGIFVSF